MRNTVRIMHILLNRREGEFFGRCYSKFTLVIPGIGINTGNNSGFGKHWVYFWNDCGSFPAIR